MKGTSHYYYLCKILVTLPRMTSHLRNYHTSNSFPVFTLFQQGVGAQWIFVRFSWTVCILAEERFLYRYDLTPNSLERMEDDLSLMQSGNLKACNPGLYGGRTTNWSETQVCLCTTFSLIAWLLSLSRAQVDAGDPHIVFSSQAAPLPGIWLPWYY